MAAQRLRIFQELQASVAKVLIDFITGVDRLGLLPQALGEVPFPLG